MQHRSFLSHLEGLEHLTNVYVIELHVSKKEYKDERPELMKHININFETQYSPSSETSLNLELNLYERDLCFGTI